MLQQSQSILYTWPSQSRIQHTTQDFPCTYGFGRGVSRTSPGGDRSPAVPQTRNRNPKCVLAATHSEPHAHHINTAVSLTPHTPQAPCCAALRCSTGSICYRICWCETDVVELSERNQEHEPAAPGLRSYHEPHPHHMHAVVSLTPHTPQAPWCMALWCNTGSVCYTIFWCETDVVELSERKSRAWTSCTRVEILSRTSRTPRPRTRVTNSSHPTSSLVCGVALQYWISLLHNLLMWNKRGRVEWAQSRAWTSYTRIEILIIMFMARGGRST